MSTSPLTLDQQIQAARINAINERIRARASDVPPGSESQFVRALAAEFPTPEADVYQLLKAFKKSQQQQQHASIQPAPTAPVAAEATEPAQSEFKVGDRVIDSFVRAGVVDEVPVGRDFVNVRLDGGSLISIKTAQLSLGPKQLEDRPAPNAASVPELLSLVPDELKSKPSWVRWKLEQVNGRLTKVPYRLNGSKASSTDPSTWNTYEAIVKDAVIDEAQGIGIMTDGSFVGFDLDGCRNPATGEIAPWARKIVDTLGAYTEITPSSMGVRVYVLGTLPSGARRFSVATSAGFGDKVGIECYDTHRYFAVTGRHVGDTTTLESASIDRAYQLCSEISREHPSDTRKAVGQFSKNDSSSSSVIFETSGTFITTKLAVLMYGKIVSTRPFVIQDEHGSKVTAPSQSEADMSLATLLAMKHRNRPDLIDHDFRESELYRPKWERLAESTIEKAIAAANKIAEEAPIVIPTIPTATTPVAATPAQAQADVAADASRDVEGTFPDGQIPDFEESLIVGSSRKLVDAICQGTTIPRQYALHFAKALACSIMTKYNMHLENVESARSYFTVFGDTGTGKGTAFRRGEIILKDAQDAGTIIVKGTRNIDTIIGKFVKIIEDVDSEAGLRDAFFDIPQEQNLPILYFVDEVKTLGQKADGKKNPEIVSSIIELANKTSIGRTKAKRNKKDAASKTRENSFLLVYICAQDGETFAEAFPRTKKQGLTDRFIPEYSPKVKSGDLPEPNVALGREAIKELVTFAQQTPRMIIGTAVKERFKRIWDSQPLEIQQSPRLRQQFLLEMYLAAFNRQSATAEQQDLDIAARAFDRQKAIRQKFFTEEIPNQVAIYISRLKKLYEDALRQLRKSAQIADVSLSIPQLMTATLAYKENELQAFDSAWRVSSKLWSECHVTGKNGHVYQKFVPTPTEDDTWLPVEMAQGQILGKGK